MATQDPHGRRQRLSADVERAEQCDAAGAHAEAVNHLASAARKHDVEAMTRLGKRLLVGDRAPCLPKDAAGLIADASARGGAEAAALLAVLYAVGASRGHDLPAALESLIVAAERGWPPAQAQLQVLAAAATEATSTSDASDWRTLGQRIDLAAWRAAPPSIDVSASPLIRSYPGFASESVCRWLIDRSRGRLSRALVYEALSREVTARPTRTNTAAVFNLLDTDLVFVLAQLRMSACLQVPLRQFEAATVLHYDEGEEITAHYDFVDPDVPGYEDEIAQRGNRIVTFLVYLNDDYGAGETTFPRLGIEHKGHRGEGLFFVNTLADGSADVRTLHEGRSPAGGEKWIVSQFVRNRPQL
jgi:prolyl 4-hydroxylase